MQSRSSFRALHLVSIISKDVYFSAWSCLAGILVMGSHTSEYITSGSLTHLLPNTFLLSHIIKTN